MAQVIVIAERPIPKPEEPLLIEKAVEKTDDPCGQLPKFRRDRTIYRCRNPNCQTEFQLKPTPRAARLVKCPEKNCQSTDIEIVRF